jgi:P-type Cu+ transporter
MSHADHEPRETITAEGPAPAGDQEAVLTVPDMGSDHCAGIVTSSLRRLEGVRDIRTNIATHHVLVSFDQSAVDPQRMLEAVERAGYPVRSVRLAGETEETGEAEEEERALRRAQRLLWIAVIPTALIMVLMAIHMWWVSIPGYLAIVAILAFPVVFIAGMETHVSGWKSLTNRTANMNVLISMGSLPPYLIGLVGFFTPMTSFIEMAATIMSFHLLGRYLEARSKGRASDAIRRLLALGAKSARVLRDGQEVEVAIQELQVGDIMVIRPGEKIPTDGEVIDGRSHVDESIATGESVPVEKGPGDTALGATINKEGLLQIRATRVGADTFLAQVVKLVQEAQGSKVPVQEFADRVTGYFVPAIILVAFASGLAWLVFADTLRPILEWGDFLPWVNPELGTWQVALTTTIAVVVIACPCALGLATPMALIVGSGMGAERGVLIRSGEAIQTMKDVRVIVLDKTGTITRGEPSLTDVVPVGGFDEQLVLRAAATIETGSEHPIGQAVVAAARARGLDLPPVRDFEAITARGVRGVFEGRLVLVGSRRLLGEADIATGPLDADLERLEEEGKTAMLVAIDGQPAGIVAVADTIKDDSPAAVAALKRLGIRPIMITGDNERTARYVAAQVGIEDVFAGVLPEGKVAAVRRLQAEYGQVVAMAGDGINDAPALKQANVGIAIGAGADVAIEAADITLVSGELSRVVDAVRLSRSTFRKILQNLFWAWFYNLGAVPIAAAGLLHPMVGVIAMTTSSLSVVGNSLLLRRAKMRPEERAASVNVAVDTHAIKTHTVEEDEMEIDPVCGMEVNPATAAASAERGGKTYYFCSRNCHETFLAEGGNATTVIDPVCGMEVEPAQAAASVEHDGQTYYFCSQGCREAFARSIRA